MRAFNNTDPVKFMNEMRKRVAKNTTDIQRLLSVTAHIPVGVGLGFQNYPETNPGPDPPPGPPFIESSSHHSSSITSSAYSSTASRFYSICGCDHIPGTLSLSLSSEGTPPPGTRLCDGDILGTYSMSWVNDLSVGAGGYYRGCKSMNCTLGGDHYIESAVGLNGCSIYQHSLRDVDVSCSEYPMTSPFDFVTSSVNELSCDPFYLKMTHDFGFIGGYKWIFEITE